uniref:Glucagon like peptide 2 receptor n=1 Tax=Sphenodon punctatus TaxID=8508 RepID=A0A8D0GPF4_SPHPU
MGCLDAIQSRDVKTCFTSLVLAGPCSCGGAGVASSVLEKTTTNWNNYRTACQKTLQESATRNAGVYCNGTFDQFVCWPHSPPGNISVPCPPYLSWLKNGNGKMFCWVFSKEEEYTLLSTFQLLSTVGYSFSLIALMLALLVLLLLRLVHAECNDNESRFSFLQALNICRPAMLFMHYFVGATSFWLLVEGIYLHTLLVTAVFSERRLLQKYIVIGWGVPVLFVAPWGIIKSQLENKGCWQNNDHTGFWWIIKGPILFSVTVNFCIFLKILKLLVSKLKAQQGTFRDYKFRLARSTLVLIPLLGIHDIVFTFIPEEQVEGLSRHIKTCIHLTMSSFHGFLIAFLYCFSNGEVKAELRKHWARFLLSDSLGCMSCFLRKIKYLEKHSKKHNSQHAAQNGLSLEANHPRSLQLQQTLAKQGAEDRIEFGPEWKYSLRGSMSESSEGEGTTGETTEVVFEESEI